MAHFLEKKYENTILRRIFTVKFSIFNNNETFLFQYDCSNRYVEIVLGRYDK